MEKEEKSKGKRMRNGQQISIQTAVSIQSRTFAVIVVVVILLLVVPVLVLVLCGERCLRCALGRVRFPGTRTRTRTRTDPETGRRRYCARRLALAAAGRCALRSAAGGALVQQSRDSGVDLRETKNECRRGTGNSLKTENENNIAEASADEENEMIPHNWTRGLPCRYLRGHIEIRR